MKATLLLLGVFAVAQGVSWNELLHTNIFPDQLDQTLMSGSQVNVIDELENILTKRGDEIYSNYLEKFGKPSNPAGDAIHETVFKHNIIKVAVQNVDYNDGQVSWYKAVNQFTDMTEAEFEANFLGYKVEELARSLANSSVPRGKPRKLQRDDDENSIDYNSWGIVSKVKDQGRCESCVPFAAAACLESSHALWHGELFDLSEQEVMDCAVGDNWGCSGGTYGPTFDYLRDIGLTTEDEYPYEAEDGHCRSEGKSHPAWIQNWWPLEPHGDEDALKEALADYGPIVVAVHVNKDFVAYGGGIFEAYCEGGRNHAILATAFGNEDGRDFWTIKNSWGARWGDNGFMRLRRNFGNICDIAGDGVAIEAHN